MDPHAQAFQDYEDRRGGVEQKFRDDFQSWKEQLEKPITPDEKDSDFPDPGALIASLLELCLRFAKDDLSACADYLKKISMPRSHAEVNLEQHAKALRDNINEHWRNGLLMRCSVLQVDVHSEYSSAMWSVMSDSIDDYLKEISDKFEPPETGSIQNKTCLDCGFLTIEKRELSRADRAELAVYQRTERGIYWTACTMAHPERTQCYRHLWQGYDLTYIDYSADGVVDELERPRGECFFPYQEGFTPEEHGQFLIRTPDFLAKMPTNHDEKAIADTIKKEATEDSRPIPEADSMADVVNKEAADITIAPNMPTKETPAPAAAIELDPNRQQIRIKAEWHNLTKRGYKILEPLVKANGAWVSGTNLGLRPDKIIKKMLPAVRDLIESSPQGYRIKRLVP